MYYLFKSCSIMLNIDVEADDKAESRGKIKVKPACARLRLGKVRWHHDLDRPYKIIRNSNFVRTILIYENRNT